MKYRYTWALIAQAIMLQLAWAEDDRPTFNEGFLALSPNQPHADLSIFNAGHDVVPGTYSVDIFVNGALQGRTEVRFDAANPEENAKPCITREMLEQWEVNIEAFPAIAAAAVDQCVDLSAAIPDASTSFDTGQLRLDVSIPQAALKRAARGAVSRDRWDSGAMVGMLDYSLNYARSERSRFFGGDASDYLSGGFRAGFNLGEWRFRHFSSAFTRFDGSLRWQSLRTYAQRDIASLNGQFTLGESVTPVDIFDGVSFRGVQLASDNAMYPTSQQGYAPVVRGVAQTNARVTIEQNGYVIYTTYVAPGPFVIDDLYSTASGGDLEVVITEADGRVTRFIQPFSALPVMLREGAWRYSATLGQFRSGWTDSADPNFFQGTLIRGLPGGVTLYGGTQLSDIHFSMLGGVGLNLKKFGAVSVDISRAVTRRPDGVGSSGASARIRYAKSFPSLGTNFQVVGYRYSSGGYRDFTESVLMQNIRDDPRPYGRRGKLEGTLAQTFGSGSLSLNLYQQDYWNTSDKDLTLRLGYTNSFKNITYGVYADRRQFGDEPAENIVSFNVSIPLGRMPVSATYTASHDRDRGYNQQTGIYGTAFDDARLTYAAQVGHNRLDGMTSSGSMAYAGSVGILSVGRSQGRGYGQTNIGISGAAVLHSHGVTLSQPLGETIAIVHAPGAKNVGIEGYNGVRTDDAGNAVVPSVSPYRVNRLALRTGQLGEEVEVKNAAVEVVPTRGAVVVANFETRIGHRVMLNLTDSEGAPIPLGAMLLDGEGREVGMVGTDGQAFATGLESTGTLTAKWGDDGGQRCSVSYQLDTPAAGQEQANGKPEAESPYRELDLQCSGVNEFTASDDSKNHSLH